MNFHIQKDVFQKFINDMSKKLYISEDIIEKDYYVCTVLNELSKNQEYLKAYFKGGTAVYKILDTMNRFSEDIDLTVEVIEGASNNSNKTRLKKSALGYKIDGLTLEKEKTKDVKQSVTAYYKYNSLFQNEKNPLHRAGEIQVEATSFTVSEPTELHTIEPIIYKYATEEERKILIDEFGVQPFELRVQKLERIFTDKIFAMHTYFQKQMYVDLSKHMYDITILFRTDRIKKFLSNQDELVKITSCNRAEELRRKGGINSEIKIKDFKCFNEDFNEDIINAYKLMQDKYIFKDEYKIPIKDVKITLNEIKQSFLSI